VSALPRVLLVGVSTRAMAESAARAGYTVTSLDAFADLDQHRSVRALSLPRDFGVPFGVDEVVDAAESIETEVIAYLSPFENHPAAVERLARGRALWGNDASVLRRAREPRDFSNAVDANDRWLVKPRASGGGHGIRWWNPGDAVPAHSYVQPFVDGTPGSIVFVAARGKVVPLGLTKQLVGDGAFGASGFRYCGNVLTAGRHLASAVLAAEDAVRECDLVGVNCIDFIVRGDVAVPIEINPRWSASMELVEQAYDISVFGAHAAACTAGELPSFELTTANGTADVFGKAIVFARHDVTCTDTHTWLTDPTVRDVPHPGEHISAGRPVCTVFGTGVDDDTCRASLVRRANRVYETLDSWASVPA
jgi:predicted ATP-grasp superfamily ATP-dependent carboligase